MACETQTLQGEIVVVDEAWVTIVHSSTSIYILVDQLCATGVSTIICLFDTSTIC